MGGLVHVRWLARRCSFISPLTSPRAHTAQSGHMGALHKVGQMYAQGIATARSCATAVHAFKVRM